MRELTKAQLAEEFGCEGYTVLDHTPRGATTKHINNIGIGDKIAINDKHGFKEAILIVADEKQQKWLDENKKTYRTWLEQMADELQKDNDQRTEAEKQKAKEEFVNGIGQMIAENKRIPLETLLNQPAPKGGEEQ